MKTLRIFAIISSSVATQAASKQHGDGGSGKQAFPRHRSFKSTFLLTLPESNDARKDASNGFGRGVILLGIQNKRLV